MERIVPIPGRKEEPRSKMQRIVLARLSTVTTGKTYSNKRTGT
jgi:hypothetical protein